MEGALLLDVVVGEGAPVLQLLPGKDESLLIGRNPLLVLNKRVVVRRIIRARMKDTTQAGVQTT